MTTQSRTKDISVNDMAAVLAAAKLLAEYGFISAKKAKDVREAVKVDAMCSIDTYGGDTGLGAIANEAYRAAR